ncbi:MAG: orotidine-5'-phosphate decarboxylase [Spiribacter sp.]|jgi:orotidine-5'-phosphate decarboxylase|nr:orotidine-5'-phosphate decarboxylase [Spiribacter sp.]MDR9479934.1 orotidine-5'-phosphate decarboxylase [Spiribacter sp.]
MTAVIIALDFPSPQTAQAFVERLPLRSCRLKVGKELFVRGGPQFVAQLVDQGWDVFLDLKFHDIPNTVAAACRAAAELGVWMVNVHALGGPVMLSAAREAIDQGIGSKPLLTAVTVLTSHDQASLKAIGINATPAHAVDRLARLSADAGLDGVVCSAQEATALRAEFGADFRRVTPGIRPPGAAANDQQRTLTPGAALQAGASDLVIGRPVTQADDPVAALESIYSEMRLTAQADERD